MISAWTEPTEPVQAVFEGSCSKGLAVAEHLKGGNTAFSDTIGSC